MADDPSLDDGASADDGSGSGGGLSDFFSGFGTFVSGVGSLAATTKQTAASVGALFNPSTGAVQATNTGPVQNGAQPQQGRPTFNSNYAATFMTWIKAHPVITGLGVVAAGLGIFFGARALLKK